MTIETIYGQSELSLASYAALNDSALSGQKASLKDAGMSDEQAKQFALQYAVVTQYNDTDTSFSATVFKYASGSFTTKVDFYDIEQRMAA